jgi:hypothetical protein
MSSAFDPSAVLARILGSAPFLIVAFGGVVLCMIRQSRPARVRIAVACALALQLGSHLVLPYLYQHIIQLTQMNSPYSGSGSGGMIVVSLIAASVSATSLGLMLFAAFSTDDRPPKVSER